MTDHTMRELVESEDYLDQLEKLGARKTDGRLRGLMWSLSLGAEEWPLVDGFNNIRLAKTDPVPGKPRLRIWFEIRDIDHVDLLYLEEDDEDY